MAIGALSELIRGVDLILLIRKCTLQTERETELGQRLLPSATMNNLNLKEMRGNPAGMYSCS
jgi:hypothetical protein